MSSKSVCQVARSSVEVGSFYTRLVVRFIMCTASVRNILAAPSFMKWCELQFYQFRSLDRSLSI
jgi:hypothetical protein